MHTYPPTPYLHSQSKISVIGSKYLQEKPNKIVQTPYRQDLQDTNPSVKEENTLAHIYCLA